MDYNKISNILLKESRVLLESNQRRLVFRQQYRYDNIKNKIIVTRILYSGVCFKYIFNPASKDENSFPIFYLFFPPNSRGLIPAIFTDNLRNKDLFKSRDFQLLFPRTYKEAPKSHFPTPIMNKSFRTIWYHKLLEISSNFGNVQHCNFYF